MWRKSSSSSPSERYIAPPDDGIVEEEEEEAVPNWLAKPRRRGASMALGLDVQKRDAAESRPARRLSRRRTSTVERRSRGVFITRTDASTDP